MAGEYHSFEKSQSYARRLETESRISQLVLGMIGVSDGTPALPYFTAPTVKPSMNRSRNRLYRIPIGRLVIRQAAISEPQ